MHELSRITSTMVHRHKMVGSRVICNPPPTDTDRDYLILLHSEFSMEQFINRMEIEGFTVESGKDYMGPDSELNQKASKFFSFRKGDLNLIVTKDVGFYRLFLKATQLATQFNLMKKIDRIALFQMILYNT